MRPAAADYLEAERIEEIVEALRRDGYQVDREAQLGDQEIDVLARRGHELLLIEVKARSRLTQSVDELARLRAAARQAGATAFRLVIVNPPLETDVTIEGLDDELSQYISSTHPPELDEMFEEPSVEGVTNVEVTSVAVRHGGTRVRGEATVNLVVNDGGESASRAVRVSDSLPFSFDVDLGTDLRLANVHDLKIDLGAYAGAVE